MEYIIGCDAHKHYSQFAVINSKGELCTQTRINHEQGALYRYLSRFPRGTPVALESIGNWYWIVDEIESSGCKPVMAHAVKAKLKCPNQPGIRTGLALSFLPYVRQGWSMGGV